MKLEDVLITYRTLNAAIMRFNEQELGRLIEIERGRARPRAGMLKRLHQRLTRVRAARERSSLLREDER